MMGIQVAHAILLQSHDIDFSDYELAEIDTKGSGTVDTEVEADTEIDTAAEVECEDTVGGVTIKLSGADCDKKPEEQKEPDVSVEN